MLRPFHSPTVILFACFLSPILSISAQDTLHDISPKVIFSSEMRVQAGEGSHTPFWLQANQHGSTPLSPSHTQLRLKAEKNTTNDSLKAWHWNYGADLILSPNTQTTFFLQQLYASVQWKKARLTLGAKEIGGAFKNTQLSTGSQALGINAHPIPMLRWELAEWWNITGRSNFAAIKGHLGFGLMADGAWRQNNVSTGQAYTKNILYHDKAGYLRLGNPDHHALNFIAGLEWGTTFGGQIYNANGWNGQQNSPIYGKQKAKDFLAAMLGLRTGDATDGTAYANTAGNTVGAWIFSLDYHSNSKKWGARVYYDHYFEDHSMMFEDYGWLDGMYGIEIQLPQNRYLTTLLFEHLNTTYQSGPIYHDRTNTLFDQISGSDNYYNHNLYQGWMNYGMAIGNALYASPLYENKGKLEFSANRFKAYHFGVSGQPTPRLNYRLLYTHLRSWGTYAQPFAEIQQQHSFLLDLHYHLSSPQSKSSHFLHQRAGWEFGLSIGIDRGSRLGKQSAVQLSILKRGHLF